MEDAFAAFDGLRAPPPPAQFASQEQIHSLLGAWGHRTRHLCMALAQHHEQFGIASLPVATLAALRPVWAELQACALHCGCKLADLPAE